MALAIPLLKDHNLEENGCLAEAKRRTALERADNLHAKNHLGINRSLLTVGCPITDTW